MIKYCGTALAIIFANVLWLQVSGGADCNERCVEVDKFVGDVHGSTDIRCVKFTPLNTALRLHGDHATDSVSPTATGVTIKKWTLYNCCTPACNIPSALVDTYTCDPPNSVDYDQESCPE